ncbi:hypothetical protein [Candidatus Cyanaurora vandensis]|uniref:hypothetical protein n=1 Tax=Candidatus Cyanaurora vandensis TaxID=2714958 RepID=UPI0025801896|nr:hypothetical protein [Candidatus Cyanaurora vandensis]
MIVHDREENVVLLAEVKAAPLTTLAITAIVERQTGIEGDGGVPLPHTSINNSSVKNSRLQIFLPMPQTGDIHYRLIELGVQGEASSADWAYQQIQCLFGEDDNLFTDFCNYWSRAFRAYDRAAREPGAAIDPVY